MLPRFANPHLIPQNYRHVTRSQLYEEAKDNCGDLREQGHAEDLAQLETYVKSSLMFDLEPPAKRRKASPDVSDLCEGSHCEFGNCLL